MPECGAVEQYLEMWSKQTGDNKACGRVVDPNAVAGALPSFAGGGKAAKMIQERMGGMVAETLANLE